MSMRSDGEGGPSRSTEADRALGSRIAAGNVQALRTAYLRYAEFAERALNDVDSTVSRVAKDVWMAAGRGRDEPNLARDPAMEERAPGDRRGSISSLQAKLVRARTDLRDIAMRGQVAADTNVRAYLDHLDTLARARDLRTVVSTQSAYFWDQWQRSLTQTCDLQHKAIDALRNATSAPTA